MSVETAVAPADVHAALEGVYDPELDRSLSELEYVEALEIDGGTVTISLRLPTGLCSPAFAWMMATDARDAVEGLPGVETARVELTDHVMDEEITEGVTERRAFEEVFEDADGDLSELRWTFDHKARMGRQFHAMEALLDAGLSGKEVAELTHADLGDEAAVSVGDRTVTVEADPIEDYLEKVAALDIDRSPDAPLFLDQDGEPIAPDDFDGVRRLMRLSAVNMDGQAHHCSMLLDARKSR